MKWIIETYSSANDFCEMNLILKNAGMAAWLYLNSMIPLHASSIVFGNMVSGFVADSGGGKSTFSINTLNQSDGQYFGDDILALSINSTRLVLYPAPATNPKTSISLLREIDLDSSKFKNCSYAYSGSEVYIELYESRKAYDQLNSLKLFFLQRQDENSIPIIKCIPPDQCIVRLIGSLHSLWLLGGKERSMVLFHLRRLSTKVSMFETTVPNGLSKLSRSWNASIITSMII